MKGAVAEAVIAAEAAKAGMGVLRPLVEGLRYDLVFDVRGHLLRVQCKSARVRNRVVVIGTRSSRHTPAGYVRTSYTAAEIDAIAAYCPELNSCYLLPIEEIDGLSTVHLRLSPAANNQQAAIRYAATFEFHGAIAQLGERLHGMQEVVGSSPTSSIENVRPLR
jgi:PD-(D/E)XK nuclease superfamily protein